MISRSERRRRQCGRRKTRGDQPTSRAAPGRAPGAVYWIGALDEPIRFYRVQAICVVDPGLDEAGREAVRQGVGPFRPLARQWCGDELHCYFAFVAVSAEYAAWMMVERMRELTNARLVYVMAAYPGDPSLEVVLTSVADDPWDDWPEDWPDNPTAD